MTSRRTPRLLLRRPLHLLAALLLPGAAWALAACDEDNDRRPPPTGEEFEILDLTELPDADTSDTAESDGEDTEDVDVDVADDVDVAEPGPTVEIVSPQVPADLSSEAIVTDARLRVDCRVQGNADGTPVDSESVLIVVTPAGGMPVTQPGRSTVSTTLFSAEFDLSATPNGALDLSCSAADQGSPPTTVEDTLSTWLDLGPRITVLTPEEGGAYSQQLDVLFRVEPRPVSPEDTMAAVDPTSVRVLVGSTEIPGITQDENGNFVGSFEFDDPALFSPPLDGAALLVIEAANTRSSTPVTRVEEVPFTADKTGPLIQFVTPTAGSLVGGLFELRVRVTDPAGVDNASVRATVAGTLMRNLAPAGNGEYSAMIDARGLDPNIVNALVQVTARDGAGNPEENGVTVTLDVHEPIADLDPPPVREFDLQGRCSTLFDPLGVDSPDHGESVPQLVELRARIEDVGNGAPSTGTVVPKAGVAASTVRLFVLDNVEAALLVDTNADGICDEINPNLSEGSAIIGASSVAVVDLAPVPVEGRAFFPSTAGDGLTEPAFGSSPMHADAECGVGGEGAPPMALCPESSPLTRIIQDEIDADPVIYGIPPLSESNCAGGAFDALGANVSEGWACVAIRAEDTLGNIAVSAPMRLCFDVDGDGLCAEAALPLPDCTGTYDAMTAMDDPALDCTPPAGFAAYPFRNVRRNH